VPTMLRAAPRKTNLGSITGPREHRDHRPGKQSARTAESGGARTRTQVRAPGPCQLVIGRYTRFPDSANSADFSAIPASMAAISVRLFRSAYSRTSAEIRIEQNFGPHIEQKCAVFAGSAGNVSSWYSRAVSGSSDNANWSRHRNSKR